MLNQPRPAALEPDGAFELPVRIYYEDTDAAGVVYYANYLRFCERARTEWLRHHGFEQHDLLAREQIAFVVRRVEADYRAPARLDDVVKVHSQIISLGRASVIFAQRVMRGTELLFDSRISIACINTASGRPVPIPTTMRSILQKSLQP